MKKAQRIRASRSSRCTPGVTIAGQPLTDGYHFAPNVVNNFGRPYGGRHELVHRRRRARQAGWLARFSARGVSDAAAVCQHYRPPLRTPSRKRISLPPPPGPPSNVSSFRLLDAYVPWLSRITSCPSANSRCGGGQASVGRCCSATTRAHHDAALRPREPVKAARLSRRAGPHARAVLHRATVGPAIREHPNLVSRDRHMWSVNPGFRWILSPISTG